MVEIGRGTNATGRLGTTASTAVRPVGVPAHRTPCDAHDLLPAIEGPRVAGEERSHVPGEGARCWCGPGSEDDSGGAPRRRRCTPPSPPTPRGRPRGRRAVGVISEDGAPLARPRHHAMAGVRGVHAGLAGHGEVKPSTTSFRCQHPRLGASGDAIAEYGIKRYRMKLNGMGSCASGVRRRPSRNVPRETRRCVACSWSPK